MAEEPDETPIDPSPPPTVPPRERRLGRLFFYGFLTLWLLTALWNLYKPLPEGVSVRGEIVDTPLNQMRFLSDVTGGGARRHRAGTHGWEGSERWTP